MLLIKSFITLDNPSIAEEIFITLHNKRKIEAGYENLRDFFKEIFLNQLDALHEPESLQTLRADLRYKAELAWQ